MKAQVKRGKIVILAEGDDDELEFAIFDMGVFDVNLRYTCNTAEEIEVNYRDFDSFFKFIKENGFLKPLHYIDNFRSELLKAKCLKL